MGTGLAGASASASMAELGYNVLAFSYHESPRRGETFVTRKITMGLCEIENGKKDCLYIFLGCVCFRAYLSDLFNGKSIKSIPTQQQVVVLLRKATAFN